MMIKEIYTVIANRLKAEVTGLKQVGWYTGPGQQAKQLATPGAYIELLPMQTFAERGREQRADIRFKVHLVTTALQVSDQRALDSHLDLVDEVFSALQGWTAALSDAGGSYAALAGTPGDYYLLHTINRSEVAPDHRLSPLMDSVQTFTCMMTWRQQQDPRYTQPVTGTGTNISYDPQ